MEISDYDRVHKKFNQDVQSYKKSCNTATINFCMPSNESKFDGLYTCGEFGARGNES